MEDWKKKTIKGFLTAIATVIKKDPTMFIKKHANELKVPVKTVRTAIKQDLSSGLNSLDYAIRGGGSLENKTNATSHPNIGLFKEELWKMSEKFISKVCKSFWKNVNKITEKMVAILSKFFCVYLFFFFN